LTLTSTHCGISITDRITDNGTWADLTANTTVNITNKVDQHSIVTIVAQGDVSIGQKVDQWSTANITSVGGKIEIGQKVDQHSGATLKAGTTVHIGQKVDQHSTVNIFAQGDVNIDQGINQHSTVSITSVTGNIHLGQDGGNSVDNSSQATLTANSGSITLDGKVAGGSSVTQHAGGTFSCPGTTGGGTITAA
jgi:hypothetical protein